MARPKTPHASLHVQHTLSFKPQSTRSHLLLLALHRAGPQNRRYASKTGLAGDRLSDDPASSDRRAPRACGIAGGRTKGVNASPRDVDEAVSRLREVEERWLEYQKSSANSKGKAGGTEAGDSKNKARGTTVPDLPSKAARLAKIKEDAKDRKLWLEGRIVHRSEPELKQHTSYLVFAVLPRGWREEDEEKASRKWPVGGDGGGQKKTGVGEGKQG